MKIKIEAPEHPQCPSRCFLPESYLEMIVWSLDNVFPLTSIRPQKNAASNKCPIVSISNQNMSHLLISAAPKNAVHEKPGHSATVTKLKWIWNKYINKETLKIIILEYMRFIIMALIYCYLERNWQSFQISCD